MAASWVALTLRKTQGARITVAGQWRNLTALPEHSSAVAVRTHVSIVREKRRCETQKLQSVYPVYRLNRQQNLACCLTRFQVAMRFRGIRQLVAMTDAHCQFAALHPLEHVLRPAL